MPLALWISPEVKQQLGVDTLPITRSGNRFVAAVFLCYTVPIVEGQRCLGHRAGKDASPGTHGIARASIHSGG